MLYGEIHPSGHFRFVNFGHPPPLVFSTEIQSFTQVASDGMAHFPPLGLEIFPKIIRIVICICPPYSDKRRADSSDIADHQADHLQETFFSFTPTESMTAVIMKTDSCSKS